MPQASEPRVALAGGSTATTMRVSSCGSGGLHRLDQCARPQRVLALADDFGVELLAAEPRAGIARRHRREEAGGEVGGVVKGAHAGHRHRRVSDQGFDQRQRPRRGGDQLARPGAQPQAELQGVEGLLRIAPFAELVAPGGVELRPAQAVGVLGREEVGDRAVAPHQAAPAGLGARPVGFGERQDPGCAFDHDVAHVGQRFADQRQPAVANAGKGRQAAHQPVHPFGSQPGLAGAAAAEHQPGGPGAEQRVLIGAGLFEPGAGDEFGLGGGEMPRRPRPPPPAVRGAGFVPGIGLAGVLPGAGLARLVLCAGLAGVVPGASLASLVLGAHLTGVLPGAGLARLARSASLAGVVRCAHLASLVLGASLAGIVIGAGLAGVVTCTGLAGFVLGAGLAGFVFGAGLAGVLPGASLAGIVLGAGPAGFVHYADPASLVLSASLAGVVPYASLAGVVPYADPASLVLGACLAGIVLGTSPAGFVLGTGPAGFVPCASLAGVVPSAGPARLVPSAGLTGFVFGAGPAGFVLGTGPAGLVPCPRLSGFVLGAGLVGIVLGTGPARLVPSAGLTGFVFGPGPTDDLPCCCFVSSCFTDRVRNREPCPGRRRDRRASSRFNHVTLSLFDWPQAHHGRRRGASLQEAGIFHLTCADACRAWRRPAFASPCQT